MHRVHHWTRWGAPQMHHWVVHGMHHWEWWLCIVVTRSDRGPPTRATHHRGAPRDGEVLSTSLGALPSQSCRPRRDMGHIQKIDREKPWRARFRAPDGREQSRTFPEGRRGTMAQGPGGESRPWPVDRPGRGESLPSRLFRGMAGRPAARTENSRGVSVVVELEDSAGVRVVGDTSGPTRRRARMGGGDGR